MKADVRETWSRGKRAELLAAWYLRFNGFFTITDFVLHDGGARKRPGQQLTDADVLAVRLPYTRERIETAKDVWFDVQWDRSAGLGDEGWAEYLIAEVSAHSCKINWRGDDGLLDPFFVEYSLRRFGQWSETEIPRLANQLSRPPYEIRIEGNGSARQRVRVLAIGLKASELGCLQIEFHSVVRFLEELFGCYGPPEARVWSDHKQWHPLISEIYKRLRPRQESSMNVDEVVEWFMPYPSVRTNPSATETSHRNLPR